MDRDCKPVSRPPYGQTDRSFARVQAHAYSRTGALWKQARNNRLRRQLPEMKIRFSLKLQPQRKPHLPLVDSVARQVSHTGDFRITVGANYTSADIHVRYIRAGIGEMRCIGEVERLRPELHIAPFAHPEATMNAEIDVHNARAAQQPIPRRPKAGLGHRSECQRVEVRHPTAGVAQDLHGRSDQVGSLGSPWHIQRRTGSRYIEWSAAV